MARSTEIFLRCADALRPCFRDGIQSSNSRVRLKIRKLGVGTREFLRFAKLSGCVPSRV